MFSPRRRTLAGVVALGSLATASGVWLHSADAQQPPPPLAPLQPVQPLPAPGGAQGQPRPDSPRIKALLRERLAVLQEVAKQVVELERTGAARPGESYGAVAAVLQAEMEIVETDPERLRIMERLHEESKAVELKLVQAQRAAVAKGGVPQAELVGLTNAALQAKITRLEVTIGLERMRHGMQR